METKERAIYECPKVVKIRFEKEMNDCKKKFMKIEHATKKNEKEK